MVREEWKVVIGNKVVVLLGRRRGLWQVVEDRGTEWRYCFW